ncbi:MAG: DUF2764 family protein [Bacteroidota bacterium]
MIRNLEYLISSLPYLSFQDTDSEQSRVTSLFMKYAGPVGQELGMLDILHKETAKFLPPNAQQLFCELDINTIHHPVYGENKTKIVAEFSKFMTAQKAAIKSLRTARKANKKELSPLEYQVLPIKQGTPLEEEIQIMELQWKKLEELSLGHYFDWVALVVYKLKLMILIRWWSFDQQKGFDVFNQTVRAY